MRSEHRYSIGRQNWHRMCAIAWSRARGFVRSLIVIYIARHRTKRSCRCVVMVCVPSPVLVDVLVAVMPHCVHHTPWWTYNRAWLAQDLATLCVARWFSRTSLVDLSNRLDGVRSSDRGPMEAYASRIIVSHRNIVPFKSHSASRIDR